MINESCWRQPVPTDILNDKSYDELDFALLCIILGRTMREDQPPVTYYQGNRKTTVVLGKGQTLLRVDHLSKVFSIDRKTLRKRVEKLKKWYSNMDIRPTPQGLIISVLEYDLLVSMDNRVDNGGTIEGQQRDNRRTTKNKIIETSKTNKTIERKETNTKVSPLFSEDSIEFKCANGFFRILQAENPKMRPPNLQHWAADFDKMLRIDKRTTEEMKEMIRFARGDPFWQKNILSPEKLRKHWDTLFHQMNAGPVNITI